MARTKQTARRSSGGKAPRKGKPQAPRKVSGKVPRKARSPAAAKAKANAARAAAGEKKKHRHRSGWVALRDIRRYQKDFNLLGQFQPFSRAVKRTTDGIEKGMRFKRTALTDLQYALEAHIVSLCESSNLNAIHAKRVTLMKKDIDLTKKIGSMSGSGVYMHVHVDDR